LSFGGGSLTENNFTLTTSTLSNVSLTSVGDTAYVLLGTMDYEEDDLSTSEDDAAALLIAFTLGGVNYTFNPANNVVGNSTTNDTTITFSASNLSHVVSGYTIDARIILNTINNSATASNAMTFLNCSGSGLGCAGSTPDGGGTNPDRGWVWARLELTNAPVVVPEPATTAFVGLGLGLLGLLARRRAKQ